MLTIAGVVLGGVYLYTKLDDEIRRHAENLLADHYQDLDVRVGGARLIEGRGILLRDVTFTDSRREGTGQRLIAIDEIFLKADARVAQLVQKKLQVDQIVVRRPRCLAVRYADGNWNLAKLLPPPKFGDGRLNMRIESGQIEFVTASDGGEPLILRDIQCVAEREIEGSRATRTPKTSASNPYPEDAAGGSAVSDGADSLIGIEIEFSSQSVEHVSIAGTIDGSSGRLSLRGKVESLQIAPQLCRHIPRDIFPRRDELNCVEGTVGFAFRVARHAGDGNRIEFSLDDGTFSGGSVDHPRLSRLVTKVAGQWSCNSDGLEIEELTGRFGEGTFSATCRRNGWQKDAPIDVNVRVANLAVDQRFIEALPFPMNGLWKKFQPEGLVDIEKMRLAFDGQKWHPEDVVIACRDLAFQPERFPYRVTNSRGKITVGLGDDRKTPVSTADLVFLGGGTDVRFRSYVTRPGPQWVGWMFVDGKGISIDDALIEAIPNDKKGRDFVKSLHPVGRIDVAWLAKKDSPSQEASEIEMDLRLQNCAIVYDRFIYPLRNINGQVHLKDRRWDLRDLQGVHSAGVVKCHGTSTPTLDGSALDLTFDCQNIALADDLHAALTPGMQDLWGQLRPRGQVDATVQLLHSTGQPKPNISVTAWPRSDSVSVYPTFFPYRFEKIEGKVVLTAGNAVFHGIRAQNGRKRMQANGECQFGPTGDWQLKLNGLTVDRLRADDYDLVAALPPKLRRLIGDLHPQGHFSLNNGQLTFRGNSASPEKTGVSWQLRLGLHAAALQVGVALENIYGAVTLAGRSDPGGCVTFGELYLDSVTYRGLQLTQVRGPLWANEEEALLGRWASQKARKPARHLTGKLYGGTFTGGARVHHAEVPKFSLDLALSDADLARFADEYLPGQHDLKGRIFGQLNLGGSGRNATSIARSLRGTGQVQLTEADIYRLPQMIALLKFLRLQEPDTTAFTKSQMKFQVNGEHVIFDQIDLRGDAISLFGKGEIGFNRRLNLTFQYVPGPGDLPLPMLRWVVREASAQVMELHVHGLLDDPAFVSEPLPGLNDALQQLSSELEPAGSRDAPPAPARGAKRLFGPPSRR